MKTFKDAYTAGELAAALGVTDRAVQMRARREGWQARRRPGRGGGNEWLVVSMPEGTALAVRMAEERTAVAAAASDNPATPSVPSTTASTLPGTPAPLDPKRRTLALARLDLVRLYLDWLRRHGKSVQSRADFLAAYDGGAWPQLLATVGPVSWKTLERWKVQQRRAGDLMAIADKRGLAHRGKSSARRCTSTTRPSATCAIR